MQHQLPQPDFQPPYFPPPFHHPPSPPPQQHLEYLTDPYGGLSGLHHYNQLGLRPREGDPNHTHVVSLCSKRLLTLANIYSVYCIKLYTGDSRRNPDTSGNDRTGNLKQKSLYKYVPFRG